MSTTVGETESRESLTGAAVLDSPDIPQSLRDTADAQVAAFMEFGATVGQVSATPIVGSRAFLQWYETDADGFPTSSEYCTARVVGVSEESRFGGRFIRVVQDGIELPPDGTENEIELHTSFGAIKGYVLIDSSLRTLEAERPQTPIDDDTRDAIEQTIIQIPRRAERTSATTLQQLGALSVLVASAAGLAFGASGAAKHVPGGGGAGASQSAPVSPGKTAVPASTFINRVGAAEVPMLRPSSSAGETNTAAEARKSAVEGFTEGIVARGGKVFTNPGGLPVSKGEVGLFYDPADGKYVPGVVVAVHGTGANQVIQTSKAEYSDAELVALGELTTKPTSTKSPETAHEQAPRGLWQNNPNAALPQIGDTVFFGDSNSGYYHAGIIVAMRGSYATILAGDAGSNLTVQLDTFNLHDPSSPIGAFGDDLGSNSVARDKIAAAGYSFWNKYKGQSEPQSVIDFTGQAPEESCADTISDIRAIAGYPFQGGNTRGRPNPADLYRVDNSQSPQQSVFTLEDYFKTPSLWKYAAVKPVTHASLTPSAANTAPATENYPTSYSIYSSAVSKSGLTAAQLNQVLAGTDLAGLGEAFHTAEEKYGINALFMLEHAGWESAWGSSEIAQLKHNLFGYGANDANPLQDAYTFKSFADCVYYYASVMKTYYLSPSGDHFNGYSIHDIFIDYSTDHDKEAYGIVGNMNYALHKVGGPKAS